MPSWETYLRHLHDTEDSHLFVTGSSSHLLSREIATGLRGRSVSYKIKATPRQPGVDEIRIPSERASRERRREEGLVLERKVIESLKAL